MRTEQIGLDPAFYEEIANKHYDNVMAEFMAFYNDIKSGSDLTYNSHMNMNIVTHHMETLIKRAEFWWHDLSQYTDTGSNQS